MISVIVSYFQSFPRPGSSEDPNVPREMRDYSVVTDAEYQAALDERMRWLRTNSSANAVEVYEIDVSTGQRWEPPQPRKL